MCPEGPFAFVSVSACVLHAEKKLAERGGFEPPVPVIPVRRFSKPLPSATQPPLRIGRAPGRGPASRAPERIPPPACNRKQIPRRGTKLETRDARRAPPSRVSCLMPSHGKGSGAGSEPSPRILRQHKVLPQDYERALELAPAQDVVSAFVGAHDPRVAVLVAGKRRGKGDVAAATRHPHVRAGFAD